MKKLFSLLSAVLFAQSALASSARIVNDDQLKSADESKTWTMPSISDAIPGVTETLTFTNKFMSGAANTFSLIPGTAIDASTPVTVSRGGTGLSTLTLNGILFGNGTSNAGVTTAGSQYQLLQAGSGGIPFFDAIHLDQAAATTGQLPVAKGGTGVATIATGNVILGAGTSPVTVVAPGTTGNCLVSNGSTWTSTTCSGGGGITAQSIPIVLHTGYHSPPSVEDPGSGLAALNISAGTTSFFSYEFPSVDFANLLYAYFRVPDNYTAGRQIKFKAQIHTTASSGTALWETDSYLKRPGTDSFSTFSLTENNTQTSTFTSANLVLNVSVALTDGTGKIGGTSVSAGDLIPFQFYKVAYPTSSVLVAVFLYPDTAQVEF